MLSTTWIGHQFEPFHPGLTQHRENHLLTEKWSWTLGFGGTHFLNFENLKALTHILLTENRLSKISRSIAWSSSPLRFRSAQDIRKIRISREKNKRSQLPASFWIELVASVISWLLVPGNIGQDHNDLTWKENIANHRQIVETTVWQCKKITTFSQAFQDPKMEVR